MVKSLSRTIAFFLIFAISVVAPGTSAPVAIAQGTSTGTAQTGASIGVEARIQPLRAGFEFPRESLRYEAEYRFVTAGFATLRVEREGNLLSRAEYEKYLSDVVSPET